MTVRVRFAPSPTGNLHLGSARAALYNWIYARQQGGQYVLRLEDTDRERSTPESEAQILRTLDWMGLGADTFEVPEDVRVIRQSDRAHLYAALIDQLRESGFLYECREAEPDVQGRKPLRGRIEGQINFTDLIRGEKEFHGDNVPDPILVRSDGSAMYNLACAIDDMTTEITHVIRGDDHMSNTPAQIAVIRALGGTPPTYGHMPMILGPDGKRLSKRHGAASVEDYMHYLPEALLNYLALLGWAPSAEGDNIFTIDDLLEKFEISRVQHAPAQFDSALLDHIQYEHFRKLTRDEFMDRYPEEIYQPTPELAWSIFFEKMHDWSDLPKLARFLPTSGADELVYDEDISFGADEIVILRAAREALSKISAPMLEADVKEALFEMASSLGLKPRKAIPVVQWAAMGQRRGISLFKACEALGIDMVLDRIDRAIDLALEAERPEVENSRTALDLPNPDLPEQANPGPEPSGGDMLSP